MGIGIIPIHIQCHNQHQVHSTRLSLKLNIVNPFPPLIKPFPLISSSSLYAHFGANSR